MCDKDVVLVVKRQVKFNIPKMKKRRQERSINCQSIRHFHSHTTILVFLCPSSPVFVVITTLELISRSQLWKGKGRQQVACEHVLTSAAASGTSFMRI